ncbi:SNU66/SART1 family protein [Dioscorea alata]|uniref:SNU66/SART1 family protein n=1 Tax=Dioscorea alata TaxID=55571 RepID=A0ACB7VAW4_DIOAL|nr:SNU66/SART1 family protein [Dioscorea alata]
MREERLKRKSDGSSEISAWVSKSRKLEENRNAEKEKAVRLSTILDEQESFLAESDDEDATGHSGKDLAGVKILHGLDKVMEGGAVVLTLKDQDILVGGDMNKDVGMLENVEIGEQKRGDEAYKAAEKNTGIYFDKFNDDTGAQRPILPQYDDPVEDDGVTLDDSGHFTCEAEKNLELRRKIEGGLTRKTMKISLQQGSSHQIFIL